MALQRILPLTALPVPPGRADLAVHLDPVFLLTAVLCLVVALWLLKRAFALVAVLVRPLAAAAAAALAVGVALVLLAFAVTGGS